MKAPERKIVGSYSVTSVVAGGIALCRTKKVQLGQRNYLFILLMYKRQLPSSCQYNSKLYTVNTLRWHCYLCNQYNVMVNYFIVQVVQSSCQFLCVIQPASSYCIVLPVHLHLFLKPYIFICLELMSTPFLILYCQVTSMQITTIHLTLCLLICALTLF